MNIRSLVPVGMTVALSVAFFLIVSVPAEARVGVGIGTGKIILDEPLRPGGQYDLPVVAILNTGDEIADYGMKIQYHMDQPEIRPDREWFSFSPASFRLETRDSRIVLVTISLPVRTPPGDYFAYIEARPEQKSIIGGASVGVAAATKLYFTVEPANAFQGAYWYLASIMNAYAPWPMVVSIVVVAAIALKFVGRFVTLNIGVRRKE